MKPVSQAFHDAVRHSHRIVIAARVVEPWQYGPPDGGEPLRVVGGDVRLDGNSDIRGSLEITVSGDDLWPTRAGDPLAMYGNEIFVERGLVLPDGSVEMVPLGYYRIDSLSQDDPNGGPIQISGSDRMAGIIDAQLHNPVQFKPGNTIGYAFNRLLRDVYPNAAIRYDDGLAETTLDRSAVVERDRYKFLKDIADSNGKTLHFDHYGVLRVEDPPDPGDAVFRVDAGAEGVLVSLQRGLTRKDVYNGIVAEGEGADTDDPVRAVVVNRDPTSPTRWGGPFGRIPRFFTSPLITTVYQALAAGAKQLQDNLGLAHTLDFGVVPHPALEPGDPVEVFYSHAERPQVHIIDQLTVSLDPTGGMDATTREQSRVLTGPLNEDLEEEAEG